MHTFILMLEYVDCVGFILLCYSLYKRAFDTYRSFFIIEILWYNARSILNECRALIQLSKKKKKSSKKTNNGCKILSSNSPVT